MFVDNTIAVLCSGPRSRSFRQIQNKKRPMCNPEQKIVARGLPEAAPETPLNVEYPIYAMVSNVGVIDGAIVMDPEVYSR